MCEEDGMEEWKECKLSEIMDLIGGGTPKTSNPDYWDGDIPWISVKDFNGERRYVGDIKKKITKLGLENSSTKILSKGDIIISARGTVGELAIIPSDMAFNQSCYGLRAKDFVDSCFLYYLLKQSVNILKHNTHGSVFDTITRETFENISVKLPPLPTQQKIAAILSSLDDKIELNNKINTNLEQQAQALFKNWFTDCMNSNTKMSNIIDVRDGTHDSPKPQESGYLLVTSKHLEAYSINPTDANFITKEDYDKINERSKVDNGDILLSMIGTVGIVSLVIDTPVTWAIKNIGLFKTSKTPKIKYYLLNYLKCDDVRNYIEQHLAGSTQKYISLSELRNVPINIPEKSILEKYNNIVTPIYEQIINNTNEIKNLKGLRDALLPKLMNGEIFDN